MKYELKRCPFCGGEARLNTEFYEQLMHENGSAVMSIECACGAELRRYSYRQDPEQTGIDAMSEALVDTWNRRPGEAEIERSVENLHEEIRELESSLKEVSKEAHEYLGKWTQALKRNEILSRVIVMKEVASVCPELATEYRGEAAK